MKNLGFPVRTNGLIRASTQHRLKMTASINKNFRRLASILLLVTSGLFIQGTATNVDDAMIHDGKALQGIQRDLCGLNECAVVCPTNWTDFEESLRCKDDEEVVVLKLLYSKFAPWTVEIVEQFNNERDDVNVEIIRLDSNSELSENIINEAKSKTGLFDIFITPPDVIGDIAEEDGWADLTGYVDSSAARAEEWSDIFVGYRKWISQFQNKILMFPLDGDVLSMFYREDVLEEFGLEVPRTWEEYNEVARATHGKKYGNQTLVGSCIGRVKGCAGAYWINLVLSSMTQSHGMSSGSLFDTTDMNPLLGEAFVQALEWMEVQAEFGASNEFEGCVEINDMNGGDCVLSYSWGNIFAVHMNDDTLFEREEGKLGVALTPGSTHVLDRESMKLVPCTADLCKVGGTFYDDIGWVNRSPYIAFGGWSCAVNNYTTPNRKNLATEFCAFASSRKVSNNWIAQNASVAIPGPDPFRKSQLDVGLWTENGYDQASVIEYFNTISTALESDNAVVDIRFPMSTEIYKLLDAEVYDYLSGVVSNEIPELLRSSTREEIADRLAREFEAMIGEYNARASTRSTILEQYQKLRNTYTIEINYNYLGKSIVYYGYTIGSLTILLAISFGIWTYWFRKIPVIKASQPFFLILVCLGVLTFSSSIFPMTVDDRVFSVEACNTACMAIPWLLCLGWSILFSALYAKLRRINLVVSHAMSFRTVTISEKDMMASFSLLFTGNLLLMILWSLLDPLVWKRVALSPTESIGFCSVSDSSAVTWKILVALLGLLNGGVLIIANVEAYKSRKLDIEFQFGESVYIGLIMMCFLQVVLVGVPLMFLVSDNAMATFFLMSSIVFIMSMSVLLLIFFPKILLAKASRSDTANRRTTIIRTSPTVRISGLEQSSQFHRGGGGSGAFHLMPSNGRTSSKDEDDDVEKALEDISREETIWRKRFMKLKQSLEASGFDASSHMRKLKILDDDENNDEGDKFTPDEERQPSVLFPSVSTKTTEIDDSHRSVRNKSQASEEN